MVKYQDDVSAKTAITTTIKHATCNKQLATNPITTAIKLATLQRNGWHHVLDACQSVARSVSKLVDRVGQLAYSEQWKTNRTTLCSEKKHPLTFSVISPWKMFRFTQNFQGIFVRN